MGKGGETVYRKLKLLSGYTEELTQVLAGLSRTRYEREAMPRHAAERLAELIIEAAIDINGELVLAAQQPPPDDYYSSFLALVQLGVCDRRSLSALPRWRAFAIAWPMNMRRWTMTSRMTLSQNSQHCSSNMPKP